MAARRAGLDTLKFFPAKAAGGTYALEQIRPVLPELAFCPTGGIGAEDAPAYLKLANVACVGGSFPAPGDAIRDGDWGRIDALARQAGATRGCSHYLPPAASDPNGNGTGEATGREGGWKSEEVPG